MLTLVIPTFFLRERKVTYETEPLGLYKALKYSIKNKPFMSFIGWNFMAQFSISIILANLIFYASNVFHVSDMLAFILFGALFVTLLPGFYFFSYVGKKLGIRTTVLASTLIVASGLMMLFLSTYYWQAIVSFCMMGFSLSGPMMFANVMIGEAADFDELKTKQRREAMFFGTNALFTKPAIGVAHGILAMTLLFSGYIPGSEIQLTSAIWGIRMVMGLFPSIAMYISLIFLFFYPGLKETEDMKKELSKLHGE